MRKFVAMIDYEDEKALEKALSLSHYEKKYDLMRYLLREVLKNLPEFIVFSSSRNRRKANGVTSPLYAGFNEWEEEMFLKIYKEVNKVRKTTKSDVLKDMIYFYLKKNEGGIAMGELERLFFSGEVTIYPYPYVKGVPEFKVSVDESEKNKIGKIKNDLKKSGIAKVKATLKIPNIPGSKEFAELLVSNFDGSEEMNGTLYLTTRKGWGTFVLEKENPTLFFSEFSPQR